MEAFEAAMMSHFIMFNLAVATISGMASAYLARRMRPGALVGLVGLLFAFIAALCIAAAGAWLVAALVSAKVLSIAVTMPLGALAWSFETGVEYALSGIAIGVLAYLFYRLRRPKVS
jgi:hypothetical protein